MNEQSSHELEMTRLNLERDRFELEKQKFQAEEDRKKREDRRLIKDAGVAVTALISLASALVAAILSFSQSNLADKQKQRELELANAQKLRELELADKEKLRDSMNAWQRDFFAFMKDNADAIFGDNAALRLVKRRMVLATFPPEVVAQLVHSLEPKSVDELALLGSDTALAAAALPPSSTAVVAQPQAPRSLPTAQVLAPRSKPQLFVQYGFTDDVNTLNGLTESLSDIVEIPGKEWIASAELMKTVEVRYYREDDRAQAEVVQKRVEQYLQKLGIATPVRLASLEGRYKNLPPKTFEVWFPRLATTKEQPDRKARGLASSLGSSGSRP